MLSFSMSMRFYLHTAYGLEDRVTDKTDTLTKGRIREKGRHGTMLTREHCANLVVKASVTLI